MHDQHNNTAMVDCRQERHSALLPKQFQLSGVDDMPIETARANCSLACGRLVALLQCAQLF